MGGVVGEAWGTYKRAFGPLLAMGTVIGLLLILLSLPTQVYTIRTYESLFRVIFDYLNTRAVHSGISDPILLEDQIMAIANMPLSTAVIFAITAGLTTGLGILGSCVLTAGAITARAGRRVSPSGAVMAVLARGLGPGRPRRICSRSAARSSRSRSSSTPGRSSGRTSNSAGGTNTVRTLLTIAALIIVLAIFYLSVRWGLAIAAILVEDLSLREGLRRSSRLTRATAFASRPSPSSSWLLQALTVTLPAVVIGVAIGLNAGLRRERHRHVRDRGHRRQRRLGAVRSRGRGGRLRPADRTVAADSTRAIDTTEVVPAI